MWAAPSQQPLRTADIRDVVQEWYAQFMQVEQETVYQMMLAASYMQIQPLVELTGATIGSWLRGKSAEQIRQTFNIVDDISPKTATATTQKFAATVSLNSSTAGQQPGSADGAGSSTVSS